MKYKKIIFLITLIILFPIPMLECRATDNDINYEITSFKISNTGTITMKGWAFIDHMDNYGGKNLTTYIVAYTGTWKDDYIKNCKDHPKKCKRYKTTQGGIKINNSIVDMYYVRCTDSACSSTRNTQRKNQIENQGYIGEIDTCTNAGSYGGSHCLYYDLGFQVSIPISDFEKFGSSNEKEVKFKIVSSVKYSGNNYEWQSSDLGILPDVCGTVFDTNCKNKSTSKVYKSPKKTSNKVCDAQSNCTWDVTWTEVKLGGLEKRIYFTALEARRFYTNTPKGGSNGTFDSPKYYNVLQFGSIQSYQNYKGDGSGIFKARMLKLEGGYWAFTSWVKAAGNLTINLTNKTKKTTGNGGGGGDGGDDTACEDFYCIGGNCDYSENNCSTIDPAGISGVSCNSSKIIDSCTSNSGFEKTTDNNLYVKDCSEQVSSNGEYYYKVPGPYITEHFGIYKNIVTTGTENGIIKSGNDYYFPITFRANIKLFEYLKYVHQNFTNNQEVISGSYFPYKFEYKVSSDWYPHDYSELIIDTLTSSNNTYDQIIKATALLNGSTTETFDIYLGLKKGETIYKKNGTSFTEVIYNESFYTDLASTKVTTLYNEDRAKALTVTFDDSNDKDRKLNTLPGQVTCDGGIGNGPNDIWEPGEAQGNINARTMTCTYSINNAYYKNNGTEYGYYIYLASTPGADYTKTTNGESIYYIPMDASETFRFKLSAQNLSLLTPITYKLDATCNVNPYNKLDPNSGSGALRYRPIDESNPFPTGVVYSNWQTYIDKYGLNRITQKSFAHIYYQTQKNISNVDSNTYGMYNEYKDIGKDGSSSFVTSESFFEYKDRDYHCRAGEFSDNCDKTIN